MLQVNISVYLFRTKILHSFYTANHYMHSCLTNFIHFFFLVKQWVNGAKQCYKTAKKNLQWNEKRIHTFIHNENVRLIWSRENNI